MSLLVIFPILTNPAQTTQPSTCSMNKHGETRHAQQGAWLRLTSPHGDPLSYRGHVVDLFGLHQRVPCSVTLLPAIPS